jgi:hypothetical protein
LPGLNEKRGGHVKIQNILRMQAVIIGFVGVLFLANSALAQEIENTVWADGPGATTSMQAAPAPAASAANAGALPSGSMAATATAAKPMLAQEAISQWPALEIWLTAAFLVLLAMVALYRRAAAARRANRNLESRVRQVNDRVALS